MSLQVCPHFTGVGCCLFPALLCSWSHRWRMVSSRGGVINNCVDSASSLCNTIWLLDFIFTSSDVEGTYIWVIKALCDPWPWLTFLRNLYCASWNNIQTWNLIIVLHPPLLSLWIWWIWESLEMPAAKNVMPLSKSIHCNTVTYSKGIFSPNCRLKLKYEAHDKVVWYSV